MPAYVDTSALVKRFDVRGERPRGQGGEQPLGDHLLVDPLVAGRLIRGEAYAQHLFRRALLLLGQVDELLIRLVGQFEDFAHRVFSLRRSERRRPGHRMAGGSPSKDTSRLCRKFCSGGREGVVAPVGGEIRRPGSRIVRPQ